MTEKRFTIVNMGLGGQFIKENGKIMTIERVVDLLNENEQIKSANMEYKDALGRLEKENEQLIKDNFELQGLLGDVRALLRLDKVDDAISRIDKFERSMKK